MNQTLLVAPGFTNCTSSSGCLPPVFPLGYESGSGMDWDNYSYYPEKLNLFVEFSLHQLPIGNGRTLDLLDLVTAQGSRDSSWKQLLQVFYNAGKTIWDGFDAVGEAVEGEEWDAVGGAVSTLQDADKTEKEAANLMYENNWYVTQKRRRDGKQPFIVPNIPAWEYNYGEPVGIAITGTITEANGTQYNVPVLFFDGGDDYTFTVQIPV
jgi:hypothetical protein